LARIRTRFWWVGLGFWIGRRGLGGSGGEGEKRAADGEEGGVRFADGTLGKTGFVAEGLRAWNRERMS
jgi:hypothetical protein